MREWDTHGFGCTICIDVAREAIRQEADVLELAPFLQLVRERDRVHRFALRVQRERRAIDLGVALAVEVARIKHFADRPDSAGGEHHRAED